MGLNQGNKENLNMEDQVQENAEAETEEFEDNAAPDVASERDETEADEVAEAEAEAGDLDNVTKEFFQGADLPKGQERINALLEAGVDVKFNFNAEDADFEFPDTHGLLIAPIAKRANNKTVNIGVLVAAVPTVQAIVAHGDNGIAFVNDCAEKMLFAKVCNSVRPRDGVEPDGVVPFSVDDFITPRRTGDSLLAYSKVAPIYVKALKSKGLKHMNGAILRDVLSSSHNAETFFPKIPQATWEKLLESMAEKAQSMDLNPALYHRWLEQRDQVAGMDDVDDLNLDDLEGI